MATFDSFHSFNPPLPLCTTENHSVLIMLTLTAELEFFFFTSQMRKWVMIHLTESESKQFLIKKPNSFDAFPSEEAREHSANETVLFNSSF